MITYPQGGKKIDRCKCSVTTLSLGSGEGVGIEDAEKRRRNVGSERLGQAGGVLCADKKTAHHETRGAGGRLPERL